MPDRPSIQPDIPPENGKRASIDRKTGEVHGSGAGAGGGNPGEDYDDDRPAGAAGERLVHDAAAAKNESGHVSAVNERRQK